VFSLQAIKHLTSGDGGLIFLPTKELYERAKRLRWFGIDREARSGNGDFRLEADIPEWGYKFHMNDINASIGLANLPYVSNNLTLLREIGMQYRQRLSKLHPIVRLLDENPDFNSARWIFTIKIVNKPEFIAFMKAKNIMTSQVHNRNDKHTCVNESITNLPHLDQLETEIVCIPAGWWLTEDEKEHVLASIEEYARNSIN
jgi:dTDP-4-amino-4,6-dideoxygalactose transaminase